MECAPIVQVYPEKQNPLHRHQRFFATLRQVEFPRPGTQFIASIYQFFLHFFLMLLSSTDYYVLTR